MEKQITYYWKELNAKYSSNQVFFMLCYWALCIYQQEVDGGEEPTSTGVWRSYLREMLRKSMDYDVQESAVRLSERIEWSLLENDFSTLDLLKEFSKDVGIVLKEGNVLKDIAYISQSGMLERLQHVIDNIYRLAALNELYPMTPASIMRMMQGLVSANSFNGMSNDCCNSEKFLEDVYGHVVKDSPITSCAKDIETAVLDINTIIRYMKSAVSAKTNEQELFVNYNLQYDYKPDIVVYDLAKGQNKPLAFVEYKGPIQDVGMKNIYSDWLYILEALDATSDNGKGSIIVTSGALTRRNEAKLRKQVVFNDWVETVITLPANLYPTTRVGTEILVFNKQKEKRRKNKILFIDISRFYFRGNRNYNSITQEGTKLVNDIFHNYYEKEGISCIVDVSEVAENTCSLKPLRYLEMRSAQSMNQDVLCLKEIAKVMRGVQLKKEEEEVLCQNGVAHYLNIKDIQEENICYEDSKKIIPKSADWHMKFQIQEDDILLTSKGTTLKIVIVGEKPPEAYICGNLTILRVNSKIYHPYILYEFLTSAEGRRALESIQSGATIRVLNNANLAELHVPKYDRQIMGQVGEQLKEKRIKYEMESKQLTHNYVTERNDLLELVGIKAR